MRKGLFTRGYVYSVINLLALHVGPYLLLSVISVYAMALTGSNTLAGVMTSVFPLAGLAGRFLAAWLLERMPPKRVTVVATAMLVAASAAYLACDNYPLAFMLRGAQGLGYSMAVTSLSTHIVDILAPDVRLEGIGYSSLTNTLCSVFGPTLAFSILGPNVDRFLPLFACVLVASSVALFMAIFSKDAQHTARAKESGEADTAGEAVPWVAVLLPVALLAAVSFAQSASSSFLSLFAIDKGFEGIGLYFTLNAVGVFASRFVMGRIVDALGDRVTVAASIALVALSTLGIASAGSAGMLYAVAVPFGFAIGMLQPVVNAHVVTIMPESKSGTANALFYAAGDVGFITGPVVWGAVAQTASYEAMFVAAAAVVGACAALSLFCGFNGRRPTKSEEVESRDVPTLVANELEEDLI